MSCSKIIQTGDDDDMGDKSEHPLRKTKKYLMTLDDLPNGQH